MKTFSQFIKTIFEDFKTVTKKFVDAGADPEEVTNYIQRFRALNNAQRLQGNEKNIDYWGKLDFIDFKDFVEAKEEEKSKTEQRKAVGQRFDLQAPSGWNFYIPLDKEAACYKADKATDWCVAKRDWDYFERYIYDPIHAEYHFNYNSADISEFRFLVYVLQNLEKKYWALLFTFSLNKNTMVELEIYNQKDTRIELDEFVEDLGSDGDSIYASIHKQVTINLRRIKEAIEKTKLNSISWLVKNTTKRNEELETLLLKSRNTEWIEAYMLNTDTVLLSAARLFATNGELAYRYSDLLPGKMWSGNEKIIDPKIIQRAEQEICKSYYKIQIYIKRATKRFPMGERTLLNDPENNMTRIATVLSHYLRFVKENNQWTEGLEALAKSGNINLCVNFAIMDLEKRFELFEDYLLDYLSNNRVDSENDVYDIWRYVREFKIQDQNFITAFIKAAGDMSETVWYIQHYAEFFDKELEELISNKEVAKQAKQNLLKNASATLRYTRYVMGRRWPEAEPVLKKSPYIWDSYKDYFNITEE